MVDRAQRAATYIQPMSIADPIFDRLLLRSRLARAIAGRPADFLLERAADDLVERLDAIQRTFSRVVDVGTPGPGLARRLAMRLPAAAVSRIGAPGTGPVDAIGDPEHLCLADSSVDLAVSALALQTANDLPGALVQIRRALRPDGLFLGALVGGRTLHELREVLTIADIELSGGASPRVAPFADLRDMGGLLQRAGFALPVADGESLTVRYPDLLALMRDLRAMGATNALVSRTRVPASRALFARAAALYHERHGDRDGRIRATFEIIQLSGWAPHDSQQRPARRGSATISLAEALASSASK